MTNTNTLPETRKVPDNVIPSGNELAVYTDVVAGYELAIAKHVGCVPVQLAFRVYDERVMWRLTWKFDAKLTRDEVRSVVWIATTKAFGAYKAELFASDDGNPNHCVAVWFTNGAKFAQAHMQF
jgi:hypothetical protein